METFCSVALGFFAAVGVCLLGAGIFRRARAKRGTFVRICFTREQAEGDSPPDVIYVVRTECEAEEVIDRLCRADGRKIFIKRE